MRLTRIIAALAACTLLGVVVPATSASALNFTCYDETNSRAIAATAHITPDEWLTTSVFDSESDTCSGNLVGVTYGLKHNGSRWLTVTSDGATHLRNQLSGLTGVNAPPESQNIWVQIKVNGVWTDVAQLLNPEGAQDLHDDLNVFCSPPPGGC